MNYDNRLIWICNCEVLPRSMIGCHILGCPKKVIRLPNILMTAIISLIITGGDEMIIFRLRKYLYQNVDVKLFRGTKKTNSWDIEIWKVFLMDKTLGYETF